MIFEDEMENENTPDKKFLNEQQQTCFKNEKLEDDNIYKFEDEEAYLINIGNQNHIISDISELKDDH